MEMTFFTFLFYLLFATVKANHTLKITTSKGTLLLFIYCCSPNEIFLKIFTLNCEMTGFTCIEDCLLLDNFITEYKCVYERKSESQYSVDYCSPKDNAHGYQLDYAGNRCLDACDFHNDADYRWCRVAGGRWGFCGIRSDQIQPPTTAMPVRIRKPLVKYCQIPFRGNGIVINDDDGGELLRSSQVTSGTSVTLFCRSHPNVAISNSICENNGLWVPGIGRCIEKPQGSVKRVHCSTLLPPINNGFYSSGPDFDVGSSRNVYCFQDFKINGPHLIFCQHDGTWSQPGACIEMAQ